MPAHGVGDDLQHGIPRRGHQPGPDAEIDVALFADGIDRAVALGRIGGAVEEGVGGLIAFQIDDAEDLAGTDLVNPVITSGNDLAVAGGIG